MERIDVGVDGGVKKASEILRGRGVILFPTDTLYGLGADAFSDEAVDKIYAIKGRDEKKPIHCIVADIAMAEKYAEITDDARLLFERLPPGGLTVILSAKGGSLPDRQAGASGEKKQGIARGLSTIGIRIPKNDFCVQLARTFGKPFTATSANVANLPTLTSIDEILAQLGWAAEGIDLVIDAGELPPSAPSTVVDLSREEPAIVREGVIPASDVWNAIRSERDN